MANKLVEAVLEDERLGRITVATVDGVCTYDLEAFVNQPAEGLLYDLNLTKAALLTLLARAKGNDVLRYVNLYAAMRVIETLKNKIQ